MRRSAFWILLVSGLFFAASANAASVTVTGCLEKGDEAGEFNLTHATGGDAQQYELTSSGKSIDLSAHLGHKVEVTGEKAASEKNEKSSVKTEEKGKHDHLKVSSLKHIAPQCP